jgi:hypothetical protein
MIRIERHEEVPPRHGKWRWSCPRYRLSGVSSTPLRDACRALLAAGAPPSESAGRYRSGHSEPDLIVSSIELGARLEPRSSGGFDDRSDDELEEAA